MIRYQSYKFRIYPTKEQENQLLRTIGCARKTYNLILGSYQELYSQYKNGDITKDEYRTKKNKINYSSYKEDYPYLGEVDSIALKYAQKHCNNAYKQFFNGQTNFPKFKKKSTAKLSYTTCRSSKTSRNLRLEKNGKLVLPKVQGYVRTRVSRNLKGTLVSATIIFEPTGKWFVSLRFEREVREPEFIHHPTNPVGLDFGLKDLLISSNGDIYTNLKINYRYQKKLARIDRKLSRQREKAKSDKRKLSQSSNYQKTKIKRAKLYEKMKNQRTDYLHKISTYIINNYDFIGLEDLSPSNMMKNHNLAYAISDVSWNMLSNMLKYKAEWQGKTVQFIDRYYPSTQICSSCHSTTGPKGLSNLNIRNWTCPHCGTDHHRDVNAARNILNESLRLFFQSISTTGTVGEKDSKPSQSLVNNGRLLLSSQEKFHQDYLCGLGGIPHPKRGESTLVDSTR